MKPQMGVFIILENLEYDKDESKTDYTEELALLQMIWEEKLAKENIYSVTDL